MQRTTNLAMPMTASSKYLVQDPQVGDQVVIVRVESGRGDLHACSDAYVGVRRLPILSPNYVIGSRSDKVLHLSVMATAEVETRVVLKLKPNMWIEVRLY